MTGVRFAVAVVTLFLSSCSVDRACERARLQALGAYESLAQAVAEQKSSQSVESAEWSYVQKRVELLESSFATSQVTWRPASKSQQELQTHLTSLQADSPERLEILRHTAEQAFERQTAFAAQCK